LRGGSLLETTLTAAAIGPPNRTMSAAFLYGLVILSAIANSVWNAMMKSAGDRVMTMVAIRVVGLALGLAALPFVDWPAAAGWKWLALERDDSRFEHIQL